MGGWTHANALTDFTKRREFLICMDSDGCVMDTVRIKHTTVMCPELVRVFALEEYADFLALRGRRSTSTRSRAASPALRASCWCSTACATAASRCRAARDIANWVRTASELSAASLQHEIKQTGSLALRKLLEWSNACNRRIQALEPTFEPFPGVRESLRQLHAVADLAVVSAANESAIASEWKRYGLAQHADIIFWAGGRQQGQLHRHDAGLRYESRKVMMVATRWATPRPPPPTAWRLRRSCPGTRPRAGAVCRRKRCQAAARHLSPEYQARLLAALRSALHG